MKNVLFLCVANSARSQMAEALGHKILSDVALVQSAGSKPSTVNPFAMAALKEIGVEHPLASSKSIQSIDLSNVDLIITLCADEVCPVVPKNVKQLHWPHEDPASVGGDDAAKMKSFRNVRDQIRVRIVELRDQITADLT